MAAANQRGGSAAGSTRLILYVGKGGVGKTTLAAATAARAAALGHRTLVVSTDIAHSLGDVLDRSLGAEPEEVADRLWAQEINVLEEVRRTWGRYQSQVAEFLRREGVSDIQADELAIIPGMEEVAALVQIGRKSRIGEYDCIVVDAAPTGETIRLLSMPESFQWYAGRIETWRGRIMRTVGPFLRGMLPNLDVVDVMTSLAERVKGLRVMLTDNTRSSYRIVVTPDRMVLKEAQRAETYLNLFEYPIDAVVVNRVVAPDAATTTGGLLGPLVARQQEVMAEIRHAFPTLPLFEAPLLPEEPIGEAALAAIGARVFAGRDPTAVMHVGPTLQVKRESGDYVLRIPMPNVELDKLNLTKYADELYVDVGNFRRRIALPLALADLEPTTARLHEGTLEVPFAVRATAPEPEPASA